MDTVFFTQNQQWIFCSMACFCSRSFSKERWTWLAVASKTCNGTCGSWLARGDDLVCSQGNLWVSPGRSWKQELLLLHLPTWGAGRDKLPCLPAVWEAVGYRGPFLRGSYARKYWSYTPRPAPHILEICVPRNLFHVRFAERRRESRIPYLSFHLILGYRKWV